MTHVRFMVDGGRKKISIQLAFMHDLDDSDATKSAKYQEEA